MFPSAQLSFWTLLGPACTHFLGGILLHQGIIEPFQAQHGSIFRTSQYRSQDNLHRSARYIRGLGGSGRYR